MNLADVNHIFIEGAPNHLQFTCPNDRHVNHKNEPQPLVLHSYGLPRRCPLCSQVLRNTRPEASYVGQVAPDYVTAGKPSASAASLLADVEDARETNLPVTREVGYGTADTEDAVPALF